MESNSDSRRKATKEMLKNNKDVKIDDDRTWYTPRYFIKSVSNDGVYSYKVNGNQYWEEREKGTWENSPRISDDDCQPF